MKYSIISKLSDLVAEKIGVCPLLDVYSTSKPRFSTKYLTNSKFPENEAKCKLVKWAASGYFGSTSSPNVSRINLNIFILPSIAAFIKGVKLLNSNSTFGFN